jgi:arsenite methyltransferase
MATRSKVHQEVQNFYADFARTRGSCCAPATAFYPAQTLDALPADIANFTAGNGDPVAPAQLQPGETVVDLGSGGGLDCFIAARQVGPEGRVIGIDMTPEMLALARQNAERLGLANVEFREGYLESLPVEDNAADIVISNCVINLSPDKPRVFREMFRVLKPGGRISVSDSVTNRPVSAQLREDSGEWCGCVSGALTLNDYVDELTRAGFVDIRLEPNLELARQALAGAGVQVQGESSGEQLRTELPDWANLDQNVFVPHLISARKPDRG